MDIYSLLLFIHISFAIIWLGSGIFLQILASRFDSAGDSGALQSVFESTERLGNTLFMPSSLVVLASGIGLVIDGSWTFGSLWVVLGLIGFLLTFLIGTLWLGPQSGRVKEAMQSDGGMSPRARAIAKRMLIVARIDAVVLFLVVFDMAVKPTGDDVGALIVMVAALALGIIFFSLRARTVEIDATESEPVAPA